MFDSLVGDLGCVPLLRGGEVIRDWAIRNLGFRGVLDGGGGARHAVPHRRRGEWDGLVCVGRSNPITPFYML